jgi:redox-sensing transcriptional repressor
VELEAKGISRVSCSVIGQDLGWSLCRCAKTCNTRGSSASRRPATRSPELIQAIETFLGWNNINEAFLVGVGNLGTALLGHERFSKFGLRIVAAFDTDPAKIGTWIHEKAVLPLDKLADLAPRMSIHWDHYDSC